MLLGTDGHEDEQEPRQRDRARRDRGRDGAADQGREDRRDGDITYDPRRRPEVSNLVLLAALCLDREPAATSQRRSAAAGAAALKRAGHRGGQRVPAPIRARRADLAGDPGYLRQVLREGNARAGAIASGTLAEVHALMGTGHGAA